MEKISRLYCLNEPSVFEMTRYTLRPKSGLELEP